MLQGLLLDRSRITELETQILELEQTISVLRTERHSAQERLDSYKYPVLTLPNEVVSEIFMQFLWTFPYCSTFGGIGSPIRLTQICQSWREIAVYTPALWRAMTCRGNNALIDMWLSRSACCSLSIKIERTFPAPDCSQALFAFLTHRSRWEHVDFDLLSSYLSVMDDGPTPLLRYLRVSIGELPNSWGSSPVIATFNDAPMLRIVALNYFAAANIVLPWAQLTSLTLEDVSPRDWVPILRQTWNLVECRLGVTYDAGAGRPWTDVTILSLESLTLTVDDNQTVDGYMESFIVPALRRLDVPESLLRHNPIETLTVFISKSGCKLQHLYIAGAISAMRSYRQAFPSITHVFSQHDDRDSEEEETDEEEPSSSESEDSYISNDTA
ncbi:hypothetical protein C8R47DRAFT_80294 [Mycena vitilis]|nr:hypothetical protein C8R47DRAFT_80294 [Mycena vitilis]